MSLNSFDSLFKSDDEKAKNGVPIPMGMNAKNENITIWVAEAGNPNHEKCQRKYSKQLEHTRKNRKAHDEVIAKIVAESILVKWEGFLDDNGAPIEPTVENKTKMLRDYKKFMTAVLEAAGDYDNYSIVDPDAEKETEKN